LKRRATSLIDSLASRAEEAQSRFAALPLSELPPNKRQDADRITAELRQQASEKQQRPLDRLADLANVVRASDSFFDDLMQAENDARRRREKLEEGLRAFHAEQLQHYCPELAIRVSGLAAGIPTNGRAWNGVNHQLDVAEQLFGRVDVHARRLVARALTRAEEMLRKSLVAGGTDPGTRNSVQSLLRQLQEHGSKQLPPVGLRRRIIEMAEGMDARRAN
jgi:hypothetical protein